MYNIYQFQENQRTFLSSLSLSQVKNSWHFNWDIRFINLHKLKIAGILIGTLGLLILHKLKIAGILIRTLGLLIYTS